MVKYQSLPLTAWYISQFSPYHFINFKAPDQCMYPVCAYVCMYALTWRHISSIHRIIMKFQRII